MGYRIIGTGPNSPVGYELTAVTACEALVKRDATREWCGRATVQNDVGREISDGELSRIAEGETAAARERLRRWNA